MSQSDRDPLAELPFLSDNTENPPRIYLCQTAVREMVGILKDERDNARDSHCQLKRRHERMVREHREVVEGLQKRNALLEEAHFCEQAYENLKLDLSDANDHLATAETNEKRAQEIISKQNAREDAMRQQVKALTVERDGYRAQRDEWEERFNDSRRLADEMLEDFKADRIRFQAAADKCCPCINCDSMQGCYGVDNYCKCEQDDQYAKPCLRGVHNLAGGE